MNMKIPIILIALVLVFSTIVSAVSFTPETNCNKATQKVYTVSGLTAGNWKITTTFNLPKQWFDYVWATTKTANVMADVCSSSKCTSAVASQLGDYCNADEYPGVGHVCAFNKWGSVSCKAGSTCTVTLPSKAVPSGYSVKRIALQTDSGVNSASFSATVGYPEEEELLQPAAETGTEETSSEEGLVMEYIKTRDNANTFTVVAAVAAIIAAISIAYAVKLTKGTRRKR